MSRLLALTLVAVLAACSESSPPPQTEPTISAAPARTESAQAVALLERSVLFGNPERAAGTVSPDGKWVAWLAPLDGVLNVWVAPSENPGAARAVTADTGRGIRNFFFPFDGKHLLYLQDLGGNEDFHLYAVPLAGGEARNLTPFDGARAGVQQMSRKFPGELLVTLNDRNPRFFDIVRIDIDSGEIRRVQENDGYAGFISDEDFNVHLAVAPRPDGGNEVLKADGQGGFAPFFTIPADDALTTQPLMFDRQGRLLMIDSRERNTAALYRLDVDSGERGLVHEDARADVSNAIVHPLTLDVQAVAVNYLRNEWTVLDAELGKDLAYLGTLGDGEISITSRSDDDTLWSVLLTRADASAKYYLYDREAGRASFWFDTRPALAGAPLVPMHALEIASRDGLTLVSYLTLPRASDPEGRGRPDSPVPMVLLVHGGPWARDGYGYHPTHQWLANRGYAVLSVNFRGSTGFGKDFINASTHQWAGKMHDDLIDAVEWAIAEGVTSRDKVAIMGGSYGGYATLVGLTFTPDVFACGVDIVGPSNLNTLLDSVPPYWESFRRILATRVGDPDTEEGRALLDARSPLNFIDNIKRPLLIGQGANDPRVKQAESDQIVEAMAAKEIPVTYVLFPDEGHGFARPQNRLAFNAVTESFLGRCLGGRVQPVGADFEGSSTHVPHGAGYLRGLNEALEGFEPTVRM
ncbi:MAG TPA: S9 family peptidase [Xanthomonadaceae bacterium]|nr:S9 family peptidase [Xanthomonadaceae bacterium]